MCIGCEFTDHTAQIHWDSGDKEKERLQTGMEEGGSNCSKQVLGSWWHNLASTLTITEWTHPSKENLISKPRHIQTNSLRASGRPMVGGQGIQGSNTRTDPAEGAGGLPWTLSASGVPGKNRKVPKSTAKIDGTLSCFLEAP